MTLCHLQLEALIVRFQFLVNNTTDRKKGGEEEDLKKKKEEERTNDLIDLGCDFTFLFFSKKGSMFSFLNPLVEALLEFLPDDLFGGVCCL